MTIDEINALPADAFVDRFGALYEHSPWIATAAAARRPFADFQAMQAALAAVVAAAPAPARLALVAAHPELAGKAAIDRRLTDASAAEQASAGLDRLSPDEYDRFHALNAAYRDRFGFPFVICVAAAGGKAGILAAMERRLASDRDTELSTALAEVDAIARLRLMGQVAG